MRLVAGGNVWHFCPKQPRSVLVARPAAACVRLCEHAERTQAVQTATASAGLVLRVLPGRRARADARGTHSSGEARSSAEALYVAEKVCLLLLLLLLPVG